jgi:hypothetical protein
LRHRRICGADMGNDGTACGFQSKVRHHRAVIGDVAVCSPTGRHL